MKQQWYIKTRKGTAGPFSARKIKKLVERGNLKPSAHIRVNEKQWRKASSVKGLRGFFPNGDPNQESDPNPKASKSHAVPKSNGSELPLTDLLQPTTTTIPASTSQLTQQREQAYVKQFGPYKTVNRPPGPDSPRIDVYIHPPSDARPFCTLVTGGMSDQPMPVPSDGPSSPRCELLLYVHKVEDQHIELLRHLASQPYHQQTWFSYGSTINNGDPPQPIFEGSPLNHYVFMFPIVGTDFDFHKSVSIEGSPLQLLHVEPITLAERQFLIKKGTDAFVGLLEKKLHSPLLNPERKCYVKKRWFGR